MVPFLVIGIVVNMFGIYLGATDGDFDFFDVANIVAAATLSYLLIAEIREGRDNE